MNHLALAASHLPDEVRIDAGSTVTDMMGKVTMSYPFIGADGRARSLYLTGHNEAFGDVIAEALAGSMCCTSHDVLNCLRTAHQNRLKQLSA